LTESEISDGSFDGKNVSQKKFRRNDFFDRSVINFDGSFLTDWHSVKVFSTVFFDELTPRQYDFDDFFDGLMFRQNYISTESLTD